MMKFNFYCTSGAATALMTLVVSSLCLAELPSNTRIRPIDLRQVDPNVLKNPTIPQGGLSPTPFVSGKVKFSAGKYGFAPVCKDAEVYLISEEYTEQPAPKPKPGEINLGSSKKPMFVYKGKVSPDPSKGNSDSKTAYYNYSVSADKKFAGKKAQVVFSPSNNICGKTPASDSDTTVVVPTSSVKKDYQLTICGIG